MFKVCTRLFLSGDEILRVCKREFFPENDSFFKQFLSSHFEQSMKCRFLRIKSSADVTLEYSSTAAAIVVKPNKRIDFRYWLLREITRISDPICPK